MQIESPEALENAEAIANVPGVDGLFLGACDLALRLGKDFDNCNVNTVMAAELDRFLEICRQVGAAPLIDVGTPEALQQAVRKGYQMICAGDDLNHVLTALGRMRTAFDEAVRDLE